MMHAWRVGVKACMQSEANGWKLIAAYISENPFEWGPFLGPLLAAKTGPRTNFGC